VANKIKNKFTFPKATEFTPRDLVVDVKNGHLYYKSNYAVFRVSGTLFSTNVDTSLSTDLSIGTAQNTEVLFNNSTTIDGIGNFTVTAATDGSGNGTVNIGNVNIDGGTIDGITALTVANNVDIGNNRLTASQLAADGLTSGRVVFAGTGGLLSDDSAFTFNSSTNTLTVSKIGAFTATGAINFDDFNMTNVDINSGTIDNTVIGSITPREATFREVTVRALSGDSRVTSFFQTDLFLTNSERDFSDNDSGGAIRLIHNSVSSAPFIHCKGGIYAMATNNAPGAIKAAQDIVAFASDKRLKENIVNIENPLQKLKQLRGVYFDWKDKTKELGFYPTLKKNEIGMIAQEVEAVIPQAITSAPFDESYEGTDREKYKTIKYDRLIPLLVECINKQQEQIDELKKQIEKCL